MTADRSATVRESVAAAGIVTGAWLLHTTLSPLSSTGDVAIYARVYRLLEQGAAAYRDFSLEYPPLAAGLFWLAGALPGDYTTVFGLLMLAGQVLAVLGALSAARALGLGRGHRVAVVALVSLTPFLLGTDLVAARYDAALAAVLAWIVAAAVRDRWVLCWALVAVGVLLKLTPLLLVPALLVMQVAANRRPGAAATARATLRSGLPGWSVAAAILLAGVVPTLALSASGTLRVLEYHAERPLQIEAVAATPVLLGHVVRGTPLVQVRSYGSDNLDGAVAGALSEGSSVVAALAVLLIAGLLALRLRRLPGAAGAAELGTVALAATLAVAVVTGKVLSPQYLLWLAPLVPLVRGRRGPATAALLALAMALSSQVFPRLYVSLVQDLDTLPILLLAARNTLLVAVAVLLVHALATLRPRPGPGPGAESSTRDPRPMTGVRHVLP